MFCLVKLATFSACNACESLAVMVARHGWRNGDSKESIWLINDQFNFGFKWALVVRV